jgi:xyloglucan-specific exo-beta-1,4-glucanase
MEIRESCFPFRKATLAAAFLLLIPITGVRHQPLKPGPPPTRGEVGEDEEGNKERLLEWIESRHRARPGVDWHAIESANLQASFAYAAALEKARGGKPVWRERGPVNQTGATSRAVLASDGKTLLVGTSQGGVFSGIPGSQVWRLATDTLNGYLYGFLVTNPQPETWVAAVTGLTEGRVYVSRNKGKTWTAPRGLPPTYYVFEMAQDGGNPKVVYVLGEVLRGDGTAAPVLAHSRDGGLSFSVVYTGDGYDRPGIWTSRVASGPLYLMTHGQLLVSTDQGSSFSPLGQAAPASSNYQLLRGSEAGAPTLYAAVGRGVYPDTLYASEDGGATWQSRFKFTGAYPFARVYGGSLAASIRDPNLVLYGAANGYRSTDGGRTFQAINQWYDYYDHPEDRLHADLNGIQFSLVHGEEKLFLSTDGGT